MRKSIAMSKLKHLEARNCGFINDLPIVIMTVGIMGKNKTALITDMAISQEKMFKQKAFEIMQKCQLKFVHFNWAYLEKFIDVLKGYGSIYNLASVKNIFEKKRERYYKNGNLYHLFSYNVNIYPLTFYNGLIEEDIFDVIITYARAYFIYSCYCSMIFSN